MMEFTVLWFFDCALKFQSPADVERHVKPAAEMQCVGYNTIHRIARFSDDDLENHFHAIRPFESQASLHGTPNFPSWHTQRLRP